MFRGITTTNKKIYRYKKYIVKYLTTKTTMGPNGAEANYFQPAINSRGASGREPERYLRTQAKNTRKCVYTMNFAT